MSVQHPPPSSLVEEEPIVRPLGNSIFEVEVTRKNRIHFFSDAVQRLESNREEAEVTLSNIRSWSPDLAQYFKLRTPDVVYNTPFRLICESDLEHVPFDSENVLRQFLAVSYCWRHEDEAWPPDGSLPYAPWPFSKPFVEAVLAERGVYLESLQQDPNYRREGIWIDQLCIHQNDKREKRHSIAMMDMIYDRCRKLIILLEDVIFTEDEIRVLEKYDNTKPTTVEDCIWKPEEIDLPHLTSLYAKVEDSRWWSRSWCWHEIEANKPWSDMRHQRFAHNATFIVRRVGGGTYGLKYLTLHSVRSATFAYGATGLELNSLRRAIRWGSWANENSPYLDPQDRRRGVERSSLLTRYFALSSTKCGIISDVISITINLSGLGVFFVGVEDPDEVVSDDPDDVLFALALLFKESDEFSNPDEVLFALAALALACGEKRPLTWMDTSIGNFNDNSTLLKLSGSTSWLSRPPQDLDTALPRITVGGVRGISSMTHQHIELDLLFFETPMELTTDEDVSVTYRIFEDRPIRSRKVVMKESPYDQFTEDNTDDNFTDKIRRSFLATACKNGLAGICRLWRALDREVVQPSFNNTRFEPFAGDKALCKGAKTLLHLLSRDNEDPTPPDRRGNSVPDDPLAVVETLISFLTFITDPRALYLMMSSGRIRCSRDEFAVVGFPMFRNESDFLDPSIYRLVMPTDLVDYPSNVRRAWIVRPMDEGPEAFKTDSGLWDCKSGKWKLVGKCVLLGEPPLLTPEGAVNGDGLLTLRRRQVVQG